MNLYQPLQYQHFDQSFEFVPGFDTMCNYLHPSLIKLSLDELIIRFKNICEYQDRFCTMYRGCLYQEISRSKLPFGEILTSIYDELKSYASTNYNKSLIMSYDEIINDYHLYDINDNLMEYFEYYEHLKIWNDNSDMNDEQISKKI